jgi:hypothetical protein
MMSEDKKREANPARHLTEQAWKGGHAFAGSTSQGGLDYHTRHYNALLDKSNEIDSVHAVLLAACEAVLTDTGAFMLSGGTLEQLQVAVDTAREE